MTELLTAAQMRAIEKAAIASGEVTGLELMERAGRGVVGAILEWRPELATAPHRAVVLCGPGNNGGDGFVVARLLKERGWEVEVFLYGRDPNDLAKLKGDAAENARRWREMGEIRRLDWDTYRSVVGEWDAAPTLCIDALFGAGLTRPLKADLLKTFKHISWDGEAGGWKYVPRMIVAIDCPSGLCMDSGKRLTAGQATTWNFYTDLTVTFHRARIGHYLNEGPIGCGDVRIAGIGLNQGGERMQMFVSAGGGQSDHYVGLLTREGITEPPALYKLEKRKASHKYHHGHALILSGGPGKGGAARLAARGALRVGAGLVTVCASPEAVPENAAQLNAIMLRPVADGAALAGMLEDERLNAIGLGPGLGVGEHTRSLVTAALEAKRGTVLDADALTSFADDPPALFALLHEACVLTPHLGEFARLFPDIAEKLKAPAETGPAYSKVDAARAAAARAGCTVLLKGPDTVIADATGRAAINSAHYERAAPWLATAGAGDVLTGMIAGLLARGFTARAAAETAAWLHVEAARRFGPGLIAEDLPEMLPAVFRDLGL